MKDTKADKHAKKVMTPLHLLQTLTRTLSEHLGEACQQAERDARKALDKLDRQHAKLQEKLTETEDKLAARRAEGCDAKTLEKTQDKLSSVREALEELQQARRAAQEYTRQLQNDIRQTLRIGKGLERIEGQASQAIDKRNNPAAPAREKTRAPRRASSKKPSPAKASEPSA